MTPNEPKKGLLLLADDKPGSLKSPEEPDTDDAMQSGDTSGQHCDGCRFYATDTGDCKRYPDWVQRMPEDWCGEWKAGAQHSDAAPQEHASPMPAREPDYQGAIR